MVPQHRTQDEEWRKEGEVESPAQADDDYPATVSDQQRAALMPRGKIKPRSKSLDQFVRLRPLEPAKPRCAVAFGVGLVADQELGVGHP